MGWSEFILFMLYFCMEQRVLYLRQYVYDKITTTNAHLRPGVSHTVNGTGIFFGSSVLTFLSGLA